MSATSPKSKMEELLDREQSTEDDAQNEPGPGEDATSETADSTQPPETEPEVEASSEVEPRPETEVSTTPPAPDTAEDATTETEVPESPAGADDDGDDDAVQTTPETDPAADPAPTPTEDNDADASETETCTDAMQERVDVTITASVLKSFFDQIAVFVDEVKLEIDENGWQLCAVDPANVAMGQIELSAGEFESFSVSEGILGIDLGDRDIREKIGAYNSAEALQLTLNPKSRKLHISGDESHLEFTQALIDPETIRQRPDIPEMEIDTSVTMEASDLSRAIKAVDMVDDVLTLTSSDAENHLRIHASGDTDDVNIEMGAAEFFEASFGDAEAMYAIEYLKEIKRSISAGDSSNEISLAYVDGFPLKVTHEWNEEGDVAELLLAPRVQSD